MSLISDQCEYGFILWCMHWVQFAVEAAITILRIDDMIRIDAGPEDDMEG